MPKVTEWVKFSDRLPTREDANSKGQIVFCTVLGIGIHTLLQNTSIIEEPAHWRGFVAWKTADEPYVEPPKKGFAENMADLYDKCFGTKASPQIREYYEGVGRLIRELIKESK